MKTTTREKQAAEMKQRSKSSHFTTLSEQKLENERGQNTKRNFENEQKVPADYLLGERAADFCNAISK